MKLMLTMLVVMIVLVLLYRIFDLGVTLTYLEDELVRTQKQSALLVLFQRAPCISIDNMSNRFSIFEKGGLIIIDGLEFECKSNSYDGGEKLLHYKDSGLEYSGSE